MTGSAAVRKSGRTGVKLRDLQVWTQQVTNPEGADLIGAKIMCGRVLLMHVLAPPSLSRRGLALLLWRYHHLLLLVVHSLQVEVAMRHGWKSDRVMESDADLGTFAGVAVT
ncbi:hypothetical protein EV2_040314 [Malus domestica]